MDLIVDANILFAVCISSGKTEEIMFSEEVSLFAPEFLFEEFEKYKNIILEKTKRSNHEFDELIIVLKKRIRTIANEETERFLNYAQQISPDLKDVDYFALAMKLNCAIWSNDVELKSQNVVKVISTNDVIRMFKL